jgi:hypothetical protein
MKRIIGWFEEAGAADHGVAELRSEGFSLKEVEVRAEPGEGVAVEIHCDDGRAAAAMRCLAAAGARRIGMETLPAGEGAEPA